jgi:hypothetical protein
VFFLDIDNNLGFAQLLGEALVILVQFLIFFLDGIALGFRAACLGSQGLAHAGRPLAPPGRQQRRVQSLAAEQRPDATGAFGPVGLREDASLRRFSGPYTSVIEARIVSASAIINAELAGAAVAVTLCSECGDQTWHQGGSRSPRESKITKSACWRAVVSICSS